MLPNRDKYLWLFGIIGFFFIIYCSISLVNHYLFRTYALDLGMFNQAIRNAAFLQKPIFTLDVTGKEMPFLATHFSPAIFIFAPLYHIFGNYTLLLVQIVAILTGGVGAYCYSKWRMSGDLVTSSIILIHFLSIWGIYSALTYDFHSNVLGAMLVPWFFLFYEQKRYKHALLVLTLALLTIETMSIWFAFIIVGLAFSNFDRKKFFQVDLPFLTFCLLAGYVIIFVIMPWLQNSHGNLQFNRYLWLGSTPIQVVTRLIESPQTLLKVLFTNTTGNSDYDYIKLEFHAMVLLSGGLLFAFKPRFLFMLVPIYLQKLIPNEYNLWGISNQYSIEFVPILSITAIAFLSEIRPNLRRYLAITIAAITLGATIYTMENRVSKWYDGINTRFYSKVHYQTDKNIKRIKAGLKVTEDSRIVSASSRLAPHLKSEKIYHFPVVNDAEYIAILIKGSTWPMNEVDFQQAIDTLKKSKSFKMLYIDKDLLIFKRE